MIVTRGMCEADELDPSAPALWQHTWPNRPIELVLRMKPATRKMFEPVSNLK